MSTSPLGGFKWAFLPQRWPDRVERSDGRWRRMTFAQPGEMIVLLRKGRLKLPEDVAAWVAKTMQDLQLTEAPLTVEVALAISTINLSHGDPADHFLAATAKVFDLTLITADEHLMHLPGIRVLANR